MSDTKFEFIGGKLAGKVWRIDMSGVPGKVIGVGLNKKDFWTIWTDTFNTDTPKLMYKVVKELPNKIILEFIRE